MGETVEKIYCCDRGDSDNALAAEIMGADKDALLTENILWSENKVIYLQWISAMRLAMSRKDYFRWFLECIQMREAVCVR